MVTSTSHGRMTILPGEHCLFFVFDFLSHYLADCPGHRNWMERSCLRKLGGELKILCNYSESGFLIKEDSSED